ncbi:PD-(D/E)XK nuclease domain-containing protein [Phascolarctobacterium succinatutens]|uniref:PD-(D/E)XK nuclease domain-containing protein n=1 Tax=Phascolarctobacterium succinatutens TaxID=626940 RepID=UPI00350E3B83
MRYNDENALASVLSIAYYSAKKDYYIFRELPTGKGFADLVFLPRNDLTLPALIVELKWDKSAQSAIKQIRDKQYTEALADYAGKVLLVGINYDKVTKEHKCVIEQWNRN